MGWLRHDNQDCSVGETVAVPDEAVSRLFLNPAQPFPHDLSLRWDSRTQDVKLSRLTATGLDKYQENFNLVDSPISVN